MTISLGVVALAVGTSVVALRRAERPIAAVVVAGLVAVAVPMLVADLIDGGRRAVQVRYNFPGVIALEVAVAFFLAVAPPRRRAVGVLALLLMAAASDARYVRANDWPTKLMSDRWLMSRVNETPSPLLIVDDRDEIAGIRFAALATGLRPDVLLLRTRPGDMTAVPDWRRRDVFVPWPTPDMDNWAQAQGAERLPGRGVIYRVPGH